jgi:mannose-6-phosphate isomerase-like protein (cupin superfamily)
MFSAALNGGLLAAPGLVIAEWNAQPGDGAKPLYIAPLHRHHEDDEAWYVLEGALSFLLDGERLDAPAGGAVVAPRGTVHTYWNPAPQPARYLLVMTPRISRLIDALHAGGDPAATFEAHRSELLGWP